jgi:predicted phage tail protein
MGIKEARNNLRSKAVARVIDVLGEGELEVIDGDKGVYLNKTKLQEANGKYNFDGIRTSYRTGTRDQVYIPNFRQLENETNVGVLVSKSGGPITRAIADLNADAVNVKIRFNALSRTNQENGTIKETKVNFRIYRQNNGGSYDLIIGKTIRGKTNSSYEWQGRVPLPAGTGPWNIRVERMTDDSNNSFTRDEFYFNSFTVIYDTKLTYPYTALVGLEVDSRRFGSSFPERRYRVRRTNAPYPSNWNPTTRVYTGVWDGTFLYGTHDNPAWYLWELITNDMFGLGDIISATGINKWKLYTIAQYCDGLVNGKPRFTFNGNVTSRTAAIKLLDSIASVFRGMIYWSAGAVDFAQDSPATATKHITPANTIDGNFNRVGSANKARHTAVIVGWNNPAMLGDIDYVIVSRDDLISRFGYKAKEIAAFGCTDEDQARRVGEWVLDSEENETEVITWKASFDHIDVFPGTKVKIFDPSQQGARFGGRLWSVAGTSVTLDAVVPLVGSFDLNVVMPDGTIESRAINSSSVVNDQTICVIASAFSQTPVDAAIWTVTGVSVTGEDAMITGIFEKAPNIFEVQALKHDPTKYARVERQITVTKPSYTIIQTGQLAPPEMLDISEYFLDNNNVFTPAVLVGWLAGNDARIQAYEYQWAFDDDELSDPVRMDTLSVDLSPVEEGLFTFQVRSVADRQVSSDWVIGKVSIVGATAKPGNVQNVRCIVTGNQALIKWDKNLDAITQYYEVRFDPSATPTWQGATVVASNVSKQTAEVSTVARIGTYLVKAVTKNGKYSNVAGTVLNTFGVAPGTLGGVIDESADWFGLGPMMTVSNTEGEDFNAYWTLSQMTSPSVAVLRETATTAIHKVTKVSQIHGLDHIKYRAVMSAAGGRNIQVKMTDNQGNFILYKIDVALKSVLSSSGSGFANVTSSVVDVAGQCQIELEFDTDENATTITTELTALSGTSDAYLGVVTSGFAFTDHRVFMTNQTLDENGSGYIEFAPDGSGYVTNAYYEFANAANPKYYDPSLSLTKKTNVRFEASFEYTVASVGGTVGDWGTLGDTASIGGSGDGITITPQIRVADAFIGISVIPDYGDWLDLTDALYTLQYAQFRFLITSDNPALTPVITSAKIAWEIPGYQESQESIVSGAGNYDVVFTQEFYQVPSIQVLQTGAATPAPNVLISNKTTTGFRVRFESSAGAVVSRTFDWTATGFGPVIT